MSQGNVVVPGIQRRENAPNECELRYFKLADATEAESLVLALRQQGMQATAKYVPGYESVQKLRPRHYELWVPATWK